MATKIITKFAIGTEQGISDLLLLTGAIAREQFAEKVPQLELENYININFNKSALLIETNSMSNQFLIVYADDEPAGYARVTSKGLRPAILDHKTAVQIADFGILTKYDEPSVRQSLFERCLSVSTMQQVVWINEYDTSPNLPFFESYGFSRNTDIKVPKDLPLSTIYLSKEKA